MMADPIEDSRITCFSSHSGLEIGLDSSLTKPKGTGTSLDDLMKRMRKDIAAGTYKLRPGKSHSDNGDEPFSGDSPFDTQLEESFRSSDYTYHVETQSTLSTAVEMSNLSAQPSNYLDSTRRFSQSTPNTPTKRQKTAPRQTNAGHARSSPPVSTQSRSLSTFNQPKQSYSHYQTQSQSSQPSPRAHLQSTSNTKMAKLRKQSAVNTANKGSPQPPAEKRAERVFEDLTNDSDSELPTQSKNSQQSKSMDKLSK